MRRSGFKPKRPAAPPDDRESRLSARAERALAAPAIAPRAARVADMGNPITGVPKTVAHRNPHLLALARGKPCLLQIPGVCNNDPATTVACHSNASYHGKAGARKADDQHTVWGCYACHCWLDAGPASHDKKEDAFERAHERQFVQWYGIAYGNIGQSEKDRAAARWALDLLIE